MEEQGSGPLSPMVSPAARSVGSERKGPARSAAASSASASARSTAFPPQLSSRNVVRSPGAMAEAR
jgi:hypothetical protein